MAKRLVEALDLELYESDDVYERHLEEGSAKGIEIMLKYREMSWDETWLRDPEKMAADEIEFFNQEFGFIRDDLSNLRTTREIVAVGNALMPSLIANEEISPSRYICITSTSQFHDRKYAEREWAADYLKNCSDPIQAYDNWMMKDNLYAEKIRSDAIKFGSTHILVDGERSISEIFRLVEKHFYTR